jgi:hypothetical protein
LRLPQGAAGAGPRRLSSLLPLWQRAIAYDQLQPCVDAAVASHDLSAGRPCERRDPSPLAPKAKKGLGSSAETRVRAVWVPAFEPVKDTDLILRCLRSKRLEGWTQRRESRPSFETRARGALLRMRSEIYSEPRKRATQYSEASVMESKSCGVLDIPAFRRDDSLKRHAYEKSICDFPKGRGEEIKTPAP